jgi:hypothetical protein
MDPITLERMTGQVSRLMEQRLGARGKDLHAKLAARSRALPRPVRRAILVLAVAEERARAPKVLRQMDPARITRAHDAAMAYLQPLGAGARLRGMLLSISASVVFALLVTGGAVAGFALWRGLIAP